MRSTPSWGWPASIWPPAGSTRPRPPATARPRCSKPSHRSSACPTTWPGSAARSPGGGAISTEGERRLNEAIAALERRQQPLASVPFLYELRDLHQGRGDDGAGGRGHDPGTRPARRVRQRAGRRRRRGVAPHRRCAGPDPAGPPAARPGLPRRGGPQRPDAPAQAEAPGGHRAVLRRAELHDAVGGPRARAGRRAAERVVRRGEPRDPAARRHRRQVHRRRDHGGLRRPRAARRRRGRRRPRGARDARRAGVAEPAPRRRWA